MHPRPSPLTVWLAFFVALLGATATSGAEASVTGLKRSQEHIFPSEDLPVADIMTTIELSEYLKLHQITIRKYAAEGIIPATRIGRTWRFDKDVIDSWISAGQIEAKDEGGAKRKG